MAFGGVQAGIQRTNSLAQMSPQDATVSRFLQYGEGDKAKGWGQSTAAKNPDGTVTITTFAADGTPAGTIIVGADGGYSNYGKDGYGATFSPSGQVIPGTEKTQGAASSLYAATGLPTGSDIRDATDELGITVPDPTGDPAYQQLVEAANSFKGAYNTAGGGVTESRALDMGTIQQLQDAASGKTPGAGESLLRGAADQNARQSLGLAATLQGTNPGMALRTGLQAFQDAGARSAADIAAIRAKEQEAARAMLANQTQGLAARDVAREGSQGALYANTVGAPYAAKEKAAAANQGLWGGLIETGGKYLASSDERGKTDIGDGTGAADAFLSSLDPKTYAYKQPGPLAPPGQRLGVMAQDLPQHDVATGPDGRKYIDASVISDVLAGMGRLHERVGAVEGGRRPQGGTAAGSAPEYAAAMDYITAPPVNADALRRVRGGRAPAPRSESMGDEQMVMVPASMARAFMASR